LHLLDAISNWNKFCCKVHAISSSERIY
jgi:hypothetical protein